jgi:hypothetical protein
LIDRSWARTDFLQIGDISIINMHGTFSRLTRTHRHIAADASACRHRIAATSTARRATLKPPAQ